jgi:hypothetical protein
MDSREMWKATWVSKYSPVLIHYGIHRKKNSRKTGFQEHQQQLSEQQNVAQLNSRPTKF